MMNERIKELSELADQMADDKIQMPGEFHPDWHDVRDQYFAELLVKEFVDIIDASRAEAIDLKLPSSSSMSILKNYVKKYFEAE